MGRKGGEGGEGEWLRRTSDMRCRQGGECVPSLEIN